MSRGPTTERRGALSPAKQALLDRLVRSGVARAAAEDGIRPRGGDGPAPLSPTQERLWFLHAMDPESSAYNLQFALRIRGALDAGALDRALVEVVRRHESLRTVFPTVDGEPVQVVRPAPESILAVDDLAGVPAEAREAEMRRRVRAEHSRPFDLAAGPVLRTLLLRVAPDDHVLAFTQDHLVGDAWSLGLIHGELSALYGAFSRGEPSPLPPLAIQYGDFAAWQRAQLEGPLVERHLEYWRRAMAGAPALLEFPSDRPRPAVQGSGGSAVAVRLPSGLAERLTVAARAEGATLFMALLAGWAALLGRWARQDDVVVGTPVAGRTREETEPLVGFFVNTLPLRADLSGDPPFRVLLERVREATVGAFAHQSVPFERLVQALEVQRSLSHPPVYQAMLTLQNAAGGQISLPGLRVERVGAQVTTAPVDLLLYLEQAPGEEGLEGLIQYSTDLFDEATVERLAGHLRRLLEAAAADPDLPLSRLPLLSDAERAEALSLGEAPATPYALLPVHRLVRAQAAATPERVAVVSGGESLTFAAVEARSNRLARQLAAAGVGPGAMVAISMERSALLPVAMLALWKAGAAYVPADPAYPDERRALMLADSGASLVLVDASSAAGTRGSGVPALAVDSLDLERGDGSPPEVEVDSDAVAYVIYTSGSTGRPKGVVVPHRGVANFLASMAREPGIAPEDVLLAVTSLSFDIAVLELLLPLVTGARVAIASRDEATDAARLADLLARSGATVMQATPATWRMLVQSGWEGKPDLALLSGGEALAPELARELLPRGRALWNLYGPTETTVWSAVQRVETEEAVSLGGPVANTRLYVVDRAGEPAPVGVPGELWIGGDGVARGYHGRPALTAERFVPDPFGHGGERLYRTGDRVRRRAGGTLEFLGRTDFQVKVRGFRIEPGEVEAALAEQPGVREAVVVVREDVPGDARIVAYLVPEADAPAADALRRALALRLPDYMLPATFVPLAALPLTPNGKVDRRALPAPDLRAPARETTLPRTPVEAVVAGFWQEALRVDTVGVDDDFFELGGHSLLATQVLVRIRSALEVDVPLRAFFQAPTVAALAERVAGARGGPVPPPLAPRPAGATPVPSRAQQRLWVMEQMDPGTAAYNMPVALRLSGPLEPEVLERVLTEVLRRHEGLRTRFPRVDGAPAAAVDPPAPVELPVADLGALPREEREAEAMRLALDAGRRPFDLERGPLVRTALFRIDDAEHLLLFCVHHIVFDAWSVGLLVREISLLYDAFAEGRPSPLPEPALQCADVAAWEETWPTGEVLDAQLAYWTDRLGGKSVALDLPTDRPRPAARSHAGGEVPVRIPGAVAEALTALGRREGATAFMALLAGYAALLHRYTGQDDVRVGAPIASRPGADAESLIGFFVNTVVLRSDFSGSPTFRELLRQARETALGAYANQDLPLERLVTALRAEREAGRIPLVQALFALQNVPRAEPGRAGLRIRLVEATTGTAKADLNLSLQEEADGIAGEMEYDADLFDPATVARLVERFSSLLAAAVADPDRPVGELPLMDAAERERLLAAWSGTASAYPRGATVPGLFEAAAAASPEAVALAWAEGSMRYGELNRRANRVAHHLRSLGVGPDTLVGIASGRSPELVVGLLAILKAGGAYLPLDPSLPPERLAFMAEDAGIRVLLAAEGVSLPLGPGVVRVPLDAAPAGAETNPERVGHTASHLAYVTFTSGSTGTPKGVMVPHRAVVRLVRNTDFARFGPDEVFLQYAPVAFDASTLELWGPLLNGGRLVIAPAGQLTPAELGEAVRTHGVTTLWLTSGLFNVMVEEQLGSLRGLRQLLAGGDVLSVPHVQRALEGLPDTRLVNGYGPTENTTFTCCWTIPAATPVEGPVPIGRPVANTRVYLLDAALQPVPAGIEGELFAGGDGVARGYLNRPALTAERFVPDPFGEPGARLYRTGDLARYRADGRIDFAGRADQQVKLRGFRIEPGEIESALCRHPEVREAAVVLREDGGGQRMLAAYVVSPAEAPEPDALREFLRGFLPDYMVPGAFVVLEALPLTANGKVDRAALPAPAGMEARGQGFVAPRDALELRLAEVWEEVLGTGPIGVEDGFFDLGGHSLTAVRLIDRVQRLTGEKLPLDTLFREPTVAAMAGLLRGQAPALPASSLVGLRTRGTKPPLFCVHGGFGSVFCFAELARRVDPDRPFYGVQPHAFFGSGDPLDRVEDMAALHLEAIRGVQPSGPYHLAGYCMGGVVALEMARRLAAEGEEVALLAMLDTKGPAAVAPHRATSMPEEEFIPWFAAALTGASTEEEMVRRMAESAAMDREARLACVLERARAAGVLPPEVAEPEAVPAWLRVYQANLRAALSYRPDPFPGRVDLLVAEDAPVPDPTLGWRDEAAFVVTRVPGNHESMLEAPHAAALARALESLIPRSPEPGTLP